MSATCHRTHGTRYFHGCYAVGDDTLWGVVRRREGTGPTWSAPKSIRAARPDGAPIYAHFGPLRQFTLDNSNHPNRTLQTRELHRYLRRRNQYPRHPDVLAAQRRERARVRSEQRIR